MDGTRDAATASTVSFTFDESEEDPDSVVAATTETTSDVEAVETEALGDGVAAGVGETIVSKMYHVPDP